MISTRLRTILPLALATVALAMTPVGCGDDGPKGGAGGSSAGGAGGRGGAGGSGGRGGTQGGTGGSGGSQGGSGGAVGGSGGSNVDAPATEGGAGGQDGAVIDTPAGMGGAGGTDAAVDMTPVVDTTPPQDMPPDNMPATTVMVSACSQINCPALLDVASQCAANESDCDYEVKMTDPNRVTNYCHENGVKKVATTTSAGGTAYTTIMEVLKPNAGGACYTLEIRGTASGSADVQSWTFKNPAGAELATATWRASNEQLTLHCGGVNYVIGDVGCPGTDGQPNDGDDCSAADCER